jgi:hypothetical protein
VPYVCACEAPQNVFGLRDPNSNRGGEFDELIVLLGDQIPTVRTIRAHAVHHMMANRSRRQGEMQLGYWLRLARLFGMFVAAAADY